MPKNHKPKGGRPSRNFEPRYAKKTSFHDRHAQGRPARDAAPADRDRFERTDRTDRFERADRSGRPERTDHRDARPGSRSPKHRGFRAEPAAGEREPKRRWSTQERAGRDEARSIRNRAESGRVDAPHRRDDRARDDRPRFDRDRRDDRFGGDRARPARDDRFGARRDDRFEGRRDERPRYDRDDRSRPSRDDRFGGDRARPARDDRFGARRDDRGASERPRFDRDRRDERPRADRGERAGGDRFGARRDNRFDGRRDDRAARPSERPRFERNDRPRDDRRTERPRVEREDRPRFERDERPRREERPARDDWNRGTAKAAAQPATEDVVHERLAAQTVEAESVADVSFADLGLGSNIVEVLRNMGAESPFPIQVASIPAVLEGRDVLARGRTGSGKTIAFGAPLVERILQSQKGKKREFGRTPRAIILAPTRELALQIDRTVQPIARSVGLFTTQIYGGVPQARQVGALKKGVDIVIGTPGRIEDLINQGKLDLSDVRIAVLDEADHMCELGFVEPVQRILRKTAEGSQKLLFSATLDREVAALVDEFLVDPAVFEVAGETQDSGTIEHRVLVIEHREKSDILTSLVDRDGRTLVFARTRAFAEMLAETFEDAGIPAVSLHGDLNQAKRTRNLQKLTSGRVNVLVATDVAARGIHVDDIDLVVQADAPDEYKTYLHRAGRTGRAGNAGRVVTLITRPRGRRMSELLARAEIDAPFDEARVGDDVIEEIAGRMPSDAELVD